MTNLETRVAATLVLHHPEPICEIHRIVISSTHTCEGPLVFRCATCAATRPQPCRTWRVLTGQDMP